MTLLKRGEIWTSAGGSDYGGKLRPVVIIQDDQHSETKSVAVCPFTSDPTIAPSTRLPIMPNDRNGLRLPWRLMIDKISTVPRTKLREKLGHLDPEDTMRLNRTMVVFLGLAIPADEDVHD